ncbi:MAG TPA: substrate-binding domain-containing protein [Tepidisphaeraceae bacterium]|nr:substrate-binding domain-containing protein [Tepidisphaeraceae bacterium]
MVDAVRSYGRGVITGIVAYTRANPHWTIAAEPVWSFGSAPDISQMNVDGVIVQIFSQALADKVMARNIPTVNVSSILPTPPPLPTVLPDHAAIAKMAADYLLSLGLRELAYCWPGEIGFGAVRMDAFLQRVVEKRANFYECNTSQLDLGKWLAQVPKPVGVFGCTDDLGRLAINAALSHGLKVPDQVAVLGVDDDVFFNNLLTPPLSSVAFPAEEVGYRAAALLDRLLDGKPPPAKPILIRPSRIIVRGSSDIVWIGDEDVGMAMRFIRENAGRPLQVNDILERVLLSRRSLTRRFQQKVGRSVSQEIRRAHIELAKHLLITTDMAMEQVAKASGCASASRLAVLFRRETGETATEFRRRSRLGSRGPSIQENGESTSGRISA